MTNLDRAWVNCLRMWKWISENLPEGFSKFYREDKKEAVNRLKTEWLRMFRFTREIEQSCFFCEYAENPRLASRCCYCPAKIVEPNFHCNLTEDSVSWIMDPVGFYKNLMRLDVIRKGAAQCKVQPTD